MSRFEFLAGARPLDFVNTVSWGDGAQERLRTYDDFVSWCRAARLPAGRANDPRVFRRALTLRACLHAVFLARTRGRRGGEAGLDGFLTRALPRMTVRRGRWTLSAPDHPEAPLWWLTWEAASLLASHDAAAVGRCANDRCLWLFVDRSRRHNRRWCDMAVCGSRAKARAWYARHRTRA